MAVLACRQLKIRLGQRKLCSKLDLQLEPGQCWAILGKNGAGKTTLLHTLAGLREPTDGEVFLQGKNLKKLTRKSIAQQLGIVLQDQQDPFPANVLETVLEGRHPYLSVWQWETIEDHRKARQSLAALHLAGMEHRDIGTLSGGERQRVAIATLLTQSPLVSLLDEPTNHLDLHHQIMALELLRERNRQQKGVLMMALHDINMVARFCTHVLMLFGDGNTLQGRLRDVLTTENLECLYGHPIRRIPSRPHDVFLPD